MPSAGLTRSLFICGVCDDEHTSVFGVCIPRNCGAMTVVLFWLDKLSDPLDHSYHISITLPTAAANSKITNSFMAIHLKGKKLTCLFFPDA